MKRFKNYWGLMVAADDGEWVSFDDYDLDINSGVCQNDSLYEVNEQVRAHLLRAEDKILDVSVNNVNLNRQLMRMDEILIEKSEVITWQCDDLMRQDISIHALQKKVTNYLSVIWFGLVPAIMGLTIIILFNNWGGQ
jgi:hypothetical protein